MANTKNATNGGTITFKNLIVCYASLVISFTVINLIRTFVYAHIYTLVKNLHNIYKIARFQGCASYQAAVNIGLGKQFGYETLSNTVEECLRIRCADVEAIRHLLMRDGLKRQHPEPIAIGGLMRFETPMPLLHDYDRLLTAEVLR